MSAFKPLASLSSGLLARPGTAKPAMRPQIFAQAAVEDLGWNDMGSAPSAFVAEPVPITAPVPSVLTERAKLEQAVTPPVKPKTPAKPKTSAKTAPTPAIAAGRKAAFTLRLDGDRHLRLRLASAVAGRSSQQLVVEALDAFLSAKPQVDALARQVPGGVTHLLSGEE